MEKEAIISALEHFGWNEQGKTKAAQALGISRATIYRKIAKYNLLPPTAREETLTRKR
ncbi:helix-turn-helix domain-containing protein [Desulfofundulus salinus]|uniref:DNA binding HTH domain-containing protein n=1 Tax=Desulfofundulus salinus TaxID=2419843 RepID=A0A494WZ95_9FIRM|nr:hypothetical protein D7024_04050 [Desulfofundulus salinum]